MRRQVFNRLEPSDEIRLYPLYPGEILMVANEENEIRQVDEELDSLQIYQVKSPLSVRLPT
jgi:hypothetical protein